VSLSSPLSVVLLSTTTLLSPLIFLLSLPLLALFLVLLVLLVLLILFVLLLVQSDSCSLLQLFEAQRVLLDRMYGSGLLLHYGKQGVFSNFGCNVTSSVGILHGDEVLVRGTDLCMDLVRYQSK
jgi:hypothetical protein